MPFPQNRNQEGAGGLIPPPAQPVRRFTTPSVGDGFWAERVDVSARDYVPLTRGTLYSTIKNAQKTVIEQFPRLYFLKETLDPFFYPWALRLWATDEDAESTYNAEVTYLKEDVDYPMYARTYTLRREVYDALPALPIGQPLSGVISVKIVAGGVGYTKDDLVTFGATFGAPAAATLVVDEAGAIINVVLVAEGTQYTTPPTVTVTSEAGLGADLVAIMQDQTAVLTSQKKVELADDDPLSQEKVRVLRIYETIPGPYVTSTKIDDDGMVITTKHRRQFCSEIVEEETIEDGNWCKTTSKETDSDVICEEVIECRPVPGNPMVSIKIDDDGKSLATIRTLKDTTTINDHEEINDNGDWIRIGKEAVSDLVAWEVETVRLVPGNPMVSIKIDDDGKSLATIRTLKDTTTIVDHEEINGAGDWIRIGKEPVSDLVAWEVETVRLVPGNPMVDIKIDEDGKSVDVIRTLKDTSTINDHEEIIGGVWVRVGKEPVSDLVAWEVETARLVPGNPMVGTKIDKDGITRDTVRTLKDTTTIVEGEVVSGAGVWVTTEKEAVSDLVAWEVVTARTVEPNGAVNPVLSYKIGGDHEIAIEQTRLKERTAITPSATEAGGNITTVEAEAVTDLVANEITTVKKFLDEAVYSLSIPNLIPQWARPQIPTIVESHILSGTASMPVLGAREFEATESQKTKLLYERRVTKIPDVEFPITVTNHQTTEEYGGALLVEEITLDESELTADQGFLIVSSETTTLAVYTGGPPDGLFMKRTLRNPGSEWPTLDGRNWNEEFQTYDLIETQVVNAATYVTPSLPDFTVEEIRPLDYVRDRRIRRTVDPSNHDSPETALISYRYHPFQFPGTLDYNRLLTFDHREGFRRAAALLAKHTIRTWWIHSGTPPTVGNTDLGSFDIDVKEIISDTVNVPVFAEGSTLGAQTYPEVLHDDITNTLGAFYPATTPSFSEYYLGTDSGSGATGSIYVLTAPGTGYSVGCALTLNGNPATVVAIGVAGSITAITQPSAPPTGVIITGITDGGAASLIDFCGGSGAAFNELIVSYHTVIPGTGWVGSEKVIAADVKQTDIPDVWKVVTESVVMR